jgi:hypothetical protein
MKIRDSGLLISPYDSNYRNKNISWFAYSTQLWHWNFPQGLEFKGFQIVTL